MRKGVEERRRVGVVPDEDREFAEASLPPNGLTRDEVRDGFRFFHAGHLLYVIDVRLVRRRAAAKPLVDSEARLETFRVLGDEPVRRVEQALRRAAVLDEGHGGVVGIALPKTVEVAERPSAPREDRLIVVADHGDVVVRLSQKAEQLELRVVRVLELVDEDVAEARAQPRRRGGMLSQQLQREGDLIAEVDHAVAVLDARIRLVGRRELLMRRRVVSFDVGVEGVPHRVAKRLRIRDVGFRRHVLVARASEEIE